MRWRHAVAGAVVVLTTTVVSAALGRSLAANGLGAVFVGYWTLCGQRPPAVTQGGTA